jgi:hypothetical protein
MQGVVRSQPVVWPQKYPEVTEPVSSSFPTTCALVATSGSWLPVSLNSRLACVVAGKVNSAMPARVVSVSLTPTPSPRVTA